MATSSHGTGPIFLPEDPGTRTSALISTYSKVQPESEIFNNQKPKVLFICHLTLFIYLLLYNLTHLSTCDVNNRFDLKWQLSVSWWPHSEPQELDVSGIWWDKPSKNEKCILQFQFNTNIHNFDVKYSNLSDLDS